MHSLITFDSLYISLAYIHIDENRITLYILNIHICHSIVSHSWEIAFSSMTTIHCKRCDTGATILAISTTPGQINSVHIGCIISITLCIAHSTFEHRLPVWVSVLSTNSLVEFKNKNETKSPDILLDETV